MGKYLHLYDTEAEFDEAYNGDSYLEPWVSYTEDIERVDYNKKAGPQDPTGEYLTFEIQSPGDVIWKGYATISYSKNDGNWTPITATSNGTPISVSSGDVLKFKGDNPNGYPGNKFGSDGATFKLRGNIMSLITSSDFENATSLVGVAHFNDFFNQCTGITDASDLVLPATTLSPSCYMTMFQSCTNMVKGPAVLPATTLPANCYSAMFKGCSSLTEAAVICGTTLSQSCCSNMFEQCVSLTVTQAVLPATILAASCYYDMFDHCESLETAPEVPATTLAESCCFGMFQHCFGMKHVQSTLPATTLASGCYNSMFADNHVLEVAPVLPATDLVTGCYHSMFCDCWKLNYLKAMFLTTPGINYTQGWLYSQDTTRPPGTFVRNASATWESGLERNANTIPAGWTIETANS